MAYAGVSRPDPGLGFRAKVLQNFQVVSSLLDVGEFERHLLLEAGRGTNSSVHTMEFHPFIKSDMFHAINFRALCGANLVA